MAADATLVSAAFREAATRAGAEYPDLKPLYESAVEQTRRGFEMITGVMKRNKEKQLSLEHEKNKRISVLTKKIEDGWEQLYSQKENLPDSTIAAIELAIKEYQDEFEVVNTVGKNDTRENSMARARISGKLSRLINGAISTRAGHMEIGGTIDNLDANNVNDDDIAPMEMAIDLRNQDMHVANGDMEVNVVDGIVTYTVRNYFSDADSKWSGEQGDVTMNIDDIKNSLPQKKIEINTKQLAQMEEDSKQAVVDASNGVSNFDAEKNKSRTEGLIKNEADLQYLMKNPIEGIGGASFFEDLLDSGELQVELIKQMFIDDNGEKMEIGLTFAELDKSGADGKPDGIIDKNDLKGLSPEEAEVWDNNTSALIDAITNIRNPAFDFTLSKNLYSNYQTHREEQNYNDKYNKEYSRLNPEKEIVSKKGGRGGGTGKIDLGVSRLTNQRMYATRQDVTAKQNQIVNAKSGDTVEGWDGKRTYQYIFHVPKSGKGYWRYQVWDGDLQRFVTKGGSEETAGGGGGAKHMTTKQVESELIPQTMITTNKSNLG